MGTLSAPEFEHSLTDIEVGLGLSKVACGHRPNVSGWNLRRVPNQRLVAQPQMIDDK